IRRLIGHFGSALAAIKHPDDWTEATVNRKRSAAIRDESWRADAKPEWEAARTLRGRIILWTDPLYPPLLRELPDAPIVLYVRGDPSLLRGPCLAVVGKRQCSSEGVRASAYFARALAEAGVTIVSGLARGVDQAAHRESVTRAGRTIAVLGTGLDVPYPAEALPLYEQIATHGLLLSELPPGAPPRPANFPIRNRIISGLALGVLVVEAAPRSGSLITARLALEQNRQVFAVPGSIGAPTAQGCQDLIRQGARPVFAAHDILLGLSPLLRDIVSDPPPEPAACAPAPERKKIPAPAAPVFRRKTPSPFPPNSPEARLLAVLTRFGQAVSIDLLDDALDLSAPELSALVVRLEVQGLIRRLPGQYYALPEVSTRNAQ
ncbi:MAG: DNA-processing protein DprA, partial [Deltaproteobacteria bacterium]|nr:DNA-processing protein DprA [Deltaproteobacteria bacterium]